METNGCDVNHLNADALLPPRKRLLAGLKKQSSDLNFPAPLASSNSESEYDIHLNSLLKSCLSNPNVSTEEIVESSKLAAVEAAKVAKAARAKAEEKATIAAKAVAAAKSALDLVATLSEEADRKEKYPKKNKMKRHVPVQALYTKNRSNSNCRTDEELARNLHRVINSSPRILKNTGSGDSKGHKHKRLKSSVPSVKGLHDNGGELNRPSTAATNVDDQVEDVDIEGSIQEVGLNTMDLNTSKLDRDHQLMLLNGEVSKTYPLRLENGEEYEALLSKSRYTESLDNLGKKKGKIKQKKLPLSICSYRDKTSPKDELKSRGTANSEDSTSRSAVGKQPLLSVEPSGNGPMPTEKTAQWKCQAFKPPVCIKQNKVMQS